MMITVTSIDDSVRCCVGHWSEKACSRHVHKGATWPPGRASTYSSQQLWPIHQSEDDASWLDERRMTSYRRHRPRRHDDDDDATSISSLAQVARRVGLYTGVTMWWCSRRGTYYYLDRFGTTTSWRYCLLTLGPTTRTKRLAVERLLRIIQHKETL